MSRSRHQLNHDRKEIFRCDVPNCGRNFVRVDLHSRHRTRHMSEYLQQQVRSSLSSQIVKIINPGCVIFCCLICFQGSTQSLHAGGSISDHESQPKISPPYGAGLKPPATQHFQAPGAAAFPICERDNQAQRTPNDAQHNATIPQEQQLLDMDMWRNKVSAPTGMPIFGGDNYARSPFTIPDDFVRFLFSGNNLDNTTNNNSFTLNNFPG
jgi:hypothetical protein